MSESIKITSLFSLILLIFALLIISCANKAGKNGIKDANPVFCNADSDCKIKDVHNCCGYYPKCVNKDYAPDISAVERECKEKGISSICGFPDITSCMCVEHACRDAQGNSN